MNGDDWLGLAMLVVMSGALGVGPILWIFTVKPRQDKPT